MDPTCVAAYRKCQPDDFRCVGTTPELCIPKEKKCDGYLDCRNGRDEERCENNMKPACRLDQFRCNTTQRCVEQSARCNHWDECGDNSDEEHCSEFAIFCNEPVRLFAVYLIVTFKWIKFYLFFLSLIFTLMFTIMILRSIFWWWIYFFYEYIM